MKNLLATPKSCQLSYMTATYKECTSTYEAERFSLEGFYQNIWLTQSVLFLQI